MEGKLLPSRRFAPRSRIKKATLPLVSWQLATKWNALCEARCGSSCTFLCGTISFPNKLEMRCGNQPVSLVSCMYLSRPPPLQSSSFPLLSMFRSLPPSPSPFAFPAPGQTCVAQPSVSLCLFRGQPSVRSCEVSICVRGRAPLRDDSNLFVPLHPALLS